MSKQAYALISSIEGTPVYWTKNQVRSTCNGKPFFSSVLQQISGGMS